MGYSQLNIFRAGLFFGLISVFLCFDLQEAKCDPTGKFALELPSHSSRSDGPNLNLQIRSPEGVVLSPSELQLNPNQSDPSLKALSAPNEHLKKVEDQLGSSELDSSTGSALRKCSELGAKLAESTHDPLSPNLAHAVLGKHFTEGGFKNFYHSSDARKLISVQTFRHSNVEEIEDSINEVQIQHDLSARGLQVLRPLGIACSEDAGGFHIRILFPKLKEDLLEYVGENIHHDSYYSSIRRMAGQLCQAFSAMHEAGVAHRDIKLENFLLDDKGNAYFADFGKAKRFTDPHLASKSFAGADEYILNSSKEDWRRANRSTRIELMKRDDTFAFGTVLMAMMIGGVPPWNSPDWHASNEKKIEDYFQVLQSHLDETRVDLDPPIARQRSEDQTLVVGLIRSSLKSSDHPKFLEACHRLIK